MNELDPAEFYEQNKKFLDIEHLKAIAQSRSIDFHPNAKEKGLIKALKANNVSYEEMLVMPSDTGGGKKKGKKGKIAQKLDELQIPTKPITESQKRAAMRDAANSTHTGIGGRILNVFRGDQPNEGVESLYKRIMERYNQLQQENG